jgi:hypothetical protein
VTRGLTIAGYLAFTVAAVGLDLLARRSQSRLATVGDVISKLSARRFGRVAVMIAWWWVGWHFFVR